MKNLKKYTLTVSLFLAVVAAGFVLPFQLYQKLLMGVCILSVLSVYFLLELKTHSIGLAALIVTAVVFPIEFEPMNSSLVLAAFVCALWPLEGVVLRRAILDPSRAVRAALAFMAIAAFSFVAGQYPWFHAPGAPLKAQLAGLSLFLFSVGLFLAVGHRVRHVVHLRLLTWLFLVAGAIVCIADVFYIGIISRWIKPESLGSLFWTWLVAVSFSQAVLNRQLSYTARISLFCLTVLTVFRAFFLAKSWVSGWLPSLVALGVISIFKLPRLTLGIGLLSFPVGLSLFAKIWDSLMTVEQYSYITRLEAWKVLWQLIERCPLIGSGPANYYYYTLLFPILGWYVKFNSHNNYVDLLAQTGFLGFFAFCWFAIEIFLLTLRLRLKVPAGFARAYATGALGGLSGSLVAGMLADWIIPFVYNIGTRGFRSSLLFWLFMGGVLALKRMSSDPKEMQAPADHPSGAGDVQPSQFAPRN
jgi:hypothetical protein